MINHKTGRIVKVGDPEALLQTLKFLLGDRASLKEMGKAARLNMENRSYERAFDETWQLYQKISGRSDLEPADDKQNQRKKAA
jgi:hypothetical protein